MLLMKNQKNNQLADIDKLSEGNFKISGILDFTTVPSILEKSRSLFSSSTSINIDFSTVEHSNSAGLALLIEWMRNARLNNQQVSFHHLPLQI